MERSVTTYVDVRVSSATDAELATAALFLAVFVELGSSQDSDESAVIAQRQRRDAVETLLVGRADWQDDRYRLVRRSAVEQTAKVLTLQELSLTHEARQRSRPSLGQHLHPLQVQLTTRHASTSSQYSPLVSVTH